VADYKLYLIVRTKLVDSKGVANFAEDYRLHVVYNVGLLFQFTQGLKNNVCNDNSVTLSKFSN